MPGYITFNFVYGERGSRKFPHIALNSVIGERGFTLCLCLRKVFDYSVHQLNKKFVFTRFNAANACGPRVFGLASGSLEQCLLLSRWCRAGVVRCGGLVVWCCGGAEAVGRLRCRSRVRLRHARPQCTPQRTHASPLKGLPQGVF